MVPLNFKGLLFSRRVDQVPRLENNNPVLYCRAIDEFCTSLSNFATLLCYPSKMPAMRKKGMPPLLSMHQITITDQKKKDNSAEVWDPGGTPTGKPNTLVKEQWYNRYINNVISYSITYCSVFFFLSIFGLKVWSYIPSHLDRRSYNHYVVQSTS